MTQLVKADTIQSDQVTRTPSGWPTIVRSWS